MVRVREGSFSENFAVVVFITNVEKLKKIVQNDFKGYVTEEKQSFPREVTHAVKVEIMVRRNDPPAHIVNCDHAGEANLSTIIDTLQPENTVD